MDWTGDALVAVSGIVVSLVFAYFPWVKDWFDKLEPTQKPLANLLVLLGVATANLLWKCRLVEVCYQNQYPLAVGAFVAALLMNQGTFSYAVKQFKKK